MSHTDRQDKDDCVSERGFHSWLQYYWSTFMRIHRMYG